MPTKNGIKSGSYHLLLFVDTQIKISVGKLGRFVFPSGYYVYTGSAMKHLEKRIARHCRKNKLVRWHIDYLTKHRHVHIQKVILNYSIQRDECERNQMIANQKGAVIIAKNFGSSDCRNGCKSHLVYFSRKPDLINE